MSAFDHATGTVLGQSATAAKSNQIPTMRTPLASFDLTGVVVTTDTMHTHTDTATAIIDTGGHYVLTVKANQPSLYTACKKLPWHDVTEHSTVSTGHSRRVRRTIKALTAPAWITFPDATHVAQIRHTTTRAGKKTIKVVYVTTSTDHHDAPPPVPATRPQDHRSIENHTHRVRDVAYDKDHSCARTRNTPQTMATLRNTAISPPHLSSATNITATLRHHTTQTKQPITLLPTP